MANTVVFGFAKYVVYGNNRLQKVLGIDKICTKGIKLQWNEQIGAIHLNILFHL